MHLESDYPHPTPRKGRCRVRVYEPEAEPGAGNPNNRFVDDHYVVVLSEEPDNTGQSVTNAIERLAGEVILDNALPPNSTVVIEHYPAESRPGGAETFDLVVFDRRDPRDRAGERLLELGDPEWKRIDRATVETLIGRPLR